MFNRQKCSRSLALVISVVAMVGVVLAPATANAAPVRQIRGTGEFDATGAVCPAPPAPYEDFIDYPPIVLAGDLVGCWYTKIDTVHDNGAPSGVYLETGRELFVGHAPGGDLGFFTTTYRFESKWAPDASTGTEVHGRCQHPIAADSGAGAFDGIAGRLNFRDIVADGTYTWTGHLTL